VQQQSIDSYAQQVLDAYDWLNAEGQAANSGRMLPLHITPYIIGLPYRMDAFEALLTELAARPDTWFATGGDIFDAYQAKG
jgi:allantoinase